jgi:outer membrane protein OmpA-like peptidoglycan-associated protein
MTGMMKRSVLVIGVALVAGLAGGCNKGLKTENEQLREQSTKLQGEKDDLTGKLTESEARRQQAESEAMAKTARVNELETQANRPQQQFVQQQPVQPMLGKNRRGGSDSEGLTNGTTVIDTLTVAGDVLFGPGSATLTKGGKTELDQVARTIKSKYNGHSVEVDGFTDSDPITKSHWTSNKQLSQARADAVEKYLLSKGLPDGRVTAMGMGAAQPKATKAQSRRVEIKIMG